MAVQCQSGTEGWRWAPAFLSTYLTAVNREENTPCYAQRTCLIVYMSLLMAAQIVVLSQVLACDATLGYEEIHNTQVLRFNGTKIRNLAHLAELTTTCDQPFMRFDLDLDVRPTPLNQVPRIRCLAQPQHHPLLGLKVISHQLSAWTLIIVPLRRL